MDAVLKDIEQQMKDMTPPKQASTPSKRRHTVVLIGLLIVGAIAATAVYIYGQGRETTDDAQVDGHIAPIAAKISGSISAIFVEDNQRVKAGQTLVQIDARDYQARVAQAKAAVEMAIAQSHGARVGVPLTDANTLTVTSAAEAQLAAATSDEARAQVEFDRAASSELAYARANVDTQHATLERSQADLGRMKTLVDRDEISRFQYDAYVASARVADAQWTAAKERLGAAEKQAQSAKAALDAAKARVNQARAQLDQSHANRKQVDISTAQAATASAAVEQAKANLEARELELTYTTVTAPVSGLVTRKTVQLGQIVQPGQSLLTVVPLDDIWITANFKETQLAHVIPGQKAEIKVDMYGRSFAAHVDSIAGATGARLSLLPPENATGNFVKIVQRIPVKLVLENVPENVVFRPGMNVVATILTR